MKKVIDDKQQTNELPENLQPIPQNQFEEAEEFEDFLQELMAEEEGEK